MTTTLVQAVRLVRDEVSAGETLADAVAFVADEAGLNPALLARKVTESYGATEDRIANTTRSNTYVAPAPKVATRKGRETSMEEDFESLAKMMGASLEDIIPGYYSKAYPDLYQSVLAIRPVSPAQFGSFCGSVGARRLDQATLALKTMTADERAAVIRDLQARF